MHFSREQLGDLYCFTSTDVFEEAATRSGITDYDSNDDELEPDEDKDFFIEPQPRIGFFGKT